MNKKFNFWIINVFLTGMISLLLDGGIFTGNTKFTPLNKEGMGTIKLSGKNPAVYFMDNGSIGRYSFREHFGRGNPISTQQKEEK